MCFSSLIRTFGFLFPPIIKICVLSIVKIHDFPVFSQCFPGCHWNASQNLSFSSDFCLFFNAARVLKSSKNAIVT